MNIILSQEVFIVSKPVQQLSLGKPSSSLSRRKRARHALNAALDTARTGKPAVAFHLSLRALDTCQNTLGFRSTLCGWHAETSSAASLHSRVRWACTAPELRIDDGFYVACVSSPDL